MCTVGILHYYYELAPNKVCALPYLQFGQLDKPHTDVMIDSMSQQKAIKLRTQDSQRNCQKVALVYIDITSS